MTRKWVQSFLHPAVFIRSGGNGKPSNKSLRAALNARLGNNFPQKKSKKNLSTHNSLIRKKNTLTEALNRR